MLLPGPAHRLLSNMYHPSRMGHPRFSSLLPQTSNTAARAARTLRLEQHRNSVKATTPPVIRYELAKLKVSTVLILAIALANCPPSRDNGVPPTLRRRCLASHRESSGRPSSHRDEEVSDRQTHGLLFCLPQELLVQILSFLDYGSALALSWTCHFFRNVDPPTELSDGDVVEYLLFAKDIRKNRELCLLACFFCPLVLRSKYYERTFRIGRDRRVDEKQLGGMRKWCTGARHSGSV